MMKFSKYVRLFFELHDDVVAFNTVNRALVLLPRDYFNNDELNENIKQEEKKALDDMDFFISREAALESLKEDMEKTDKLIISIETNLSCNLRCPYCYQIGGNDKKRELAGENIDAVIDYFKIVYEISPYKELNLKVLGGEPTIAWTKFLHIFENAKEFCKTNSVKLNMMIDTNGTNIEGIMKLSGYDSLLLTVPITYEKCHDRIRKDANGSGTYDLIISNLNTLSSIKPEIKLILRHNTDHENYLFFEDFIKDIKDKLSFPPVVTVNYTMNLGEGNYLNKLAYYEFVEWQSTTALDILIKYNMAITFAPILAGEKCQCFSKYSLKMFSDGTVGACAMYFFENDRPGIKELIKNIDGLSKYWDGIKNFSIFDIEKCQKCDSIFLCGGNFHLPCVKSLELKSCLKDGNYNLNLSSFMKRYVKCLETEKEELFVAFNDTMSIK